MAVAAAECNVRGKGIPPVSIALVFLRIRTGCSSDVPNAFCLIKPSDPPYKANRGLGLTTHIIDHCKLILKFLEGTNSTWFKTFEPLEYIYDICEAILIWEEYRNMTTVLTSEYLDARPDGWLDYAAKRIAQLLLKMCQGLQQSITLQGESHMVLPAKPPFHPRQFQKCAVVGKSGDLLKTEIGEETDSHDAVIRDNEAPVNGVTEQSEF